MDNVVQLFNSNSDASDSDAEVMLSATTERILALMWHLGHVIDDLSTKFDAIDVAVDAIDDARARKRWTCAIDCSREALSQAILDITRQIGKLRRSDER